ncbi:MAG: BamA/TamA family outer membrane protein [Prevotellaceae bacterium]|jgi:outer membrane protein assembly factor BamA|nr:BamA/TamA family outer membrane protein [Prevotellaceae bacterium]
MPKNKHINNIITLAIFIVAAWFFASCSSAKLLDDGKYELVKNKIEINTKKINKSDIELYIKHRPAKSSIFKKKELVTLDTELVEKSKSNIKIYVNELGYYSNNVSDTIIYNKNKATVVYRIEAFEPFKINNMYYEIADKNIREFIFSDSLNTKIKQGSVLSTENLEAERERITANLRNNGYFNFNKTYIMFRASDTSAGKKIVDIKMIIENPSKIDSLGSRVYYNHKQYRIKDVYIFTRADASRVLREPRFGQGLDTLKLDNMNLIYRKPQNIDEDLFIRTNLITQNDIYNEQNVNQTNSNFANLNLFRTQRIEFEEIDDTDIDGEFSYLSCHIYLLPLTIQGYDLGLEISTNSSELWGISPTIGYIHRNFLKGAERFELNLSGMYQFRIGNKQGYKKSIEFGINTSLNIPKFLMPVQIKYFQKNIPQTRFAANYLHQRRNIYTRTIAGLSFGYEWNSSDFSRFTLNLIELKSVQLKNISQDFYTKISKDPYVRSLYENYFSLGLSTTFTHTNQLETYTKSTHYFRVNFDIAGNVMNLFNTLMKKDADGKHIILNTRYSQFARVDATFTRNIIIDKNNKLVYRLFAGVGRAYGNSISLPFEKMFYAGGANSMRGWQVRTIGPGSAERDTIFLIPNQVADFRLEFNAELRFKVVWLLEGAVFFDAGNIWTLNKDDNRKGARFEFNTFFKTIATNTGIGARFNINNLFTIRIDWGFRIHDPALPNHRFVKVKDWFSGDNNSIHFAINYPF